MSISILNDRNPSISVGLDVHKKTVTIAAVPEHAAPSSSSARFSHGPDGASQDLDALEHKGHSLLLLRGELRRLPPEPGAGPMGLQLPGHRTVDDAGSAQSVQEERQAQM